MSAHFELERELIARNIWPVAGVDEVGRGPLAGPVCVAAVILHPRDLPEGIDDSKKLAPPKREALYEAICARALSIAVAMAPAFRNSPAVSRFTPPVGIIWMCGRGPFSALMYFGPPREFAGKTFTTSAPCSQAVRTSVGVSAPAHTTFE